MFTYGAILTGNLKNSFCDMTYDKFNSFIFNVIIYESLLFNRCYFNFSFPKSIRYSWTFSSGLFITVLLCSLFIFF